MKTYFDYTTQELDTIYAQLSEVAQDFVYSDVIADEVSVIGKETGLTIGKWEDLNTLVLETILGITPSADFRTQVIERITTDREVAQKIVDHMETQIFSIIRDESVDAYEEENDKNIGLGDEALYDTSVSNASLDPYRELTGATGKGATIITKERLDLVDELFAPYHKNSPKESAPVTLGIGVADPVPPPNPIIITRETLAKLEGTVYTPNSKQSASTTQNLPTNNIDLTKKENATVPNNIPSAYTMMFEKGSTPNTFKITLKANKRTAPQNSVLIKDLKQSTVQNYPKDPYRELA